MLFYRKVFLTLSCNILENMSLPQNFTKTKQLSYMNKIPFLFKSLCIAVLLVSCENKIGKLEPKTPPVPPNACDSIKYNAHIKPIIISKCAVATCHVPGGSGNGDFTNHGGISAKANTTLKGRLNATTNTMPPSSHGGKLPQSKIDSIECWINNGAPNN